MTRTTLIVAIATAIVFWLSPATTVRSAADNNFQELTAKIDSLRIHADYAAALELAKKRLVQKQNDSNARDWEVANAKRLVETLSYVAGLPRVDQEKLAEADRSTLDYIQLYAKGDYAQAAAVAERQLAVRRAILGDDNQETIDSLSRLANSLYDQSDFSAADSLFTLTLEKRRTLLGENHPETAGSVHDLAVVKFTLGDYAASEPLHREALAKRRELYGAQHLEIAESLNDVAVFHYVTGDYRGAEKLYREALVMRRNLLGDDNAIVAESLNNLATVLYFQGDYAAAEPLLRKSLAVHRKLLGNDHPDVAILLNNLAMLLKTQGEYAAAEPLYKEALEISRAALGEQHTEVARCLNNLARLYQAQGHYEAAEPLFREALAIWKTTLGSDHPDVASCHANLSIMLREQGDLEGAETHIREALAIDRNHYGNDHPNTAADLNSLATVLQARGDYADAEPLFRESLEIRQEMLGEEHPDVAVGLRDLAVLLFALGQFEEAEELLAQAGRVYDAARVRAGSGLKRVLFRRSPYSLLAVARLERGETTAAWPAAEKDLGRALADLLMTADQRQLTPAEATHEDSLKTLLGGCERELAAYQKAAAGESGAEAAAQFEASRNRLLAAEAAWSAFQADIAAKYPVTEGQAFSLERVQAALDPTTALIGWLDVEWGKENYASWIYVIRHEGPVVWERLGTVARGDDPSPYERVRQFRNDLLWPGTDAAESIRWAQNLWSERIAPVTGALEGIDHLVVIPSGAMLAVPVEALADRDAVLLGERFVVSYTPSATIYAWQREHSKTRPATTLRATLLVGDPPFAPEHLVAMETETAEPVDLAATRSSGAKPRTPAYEAIIRSALSGDAAALASLPRLPASRDEVKAIASISPEPTLLLGPEASEQRLSELSETGTLKGFSTIHLATHAFVDDERPEKSALVLSQVGLPEPLESVMAGTRIYDGLVSATEIVREWELDADLVTLSACETGLGRKVSGEGYVGFSHAFFQAGARSLLVSLWEVEDRATSLLMQRFYENYFGAAREGGAPQRARTKAAALSEAKTWLRNYENEHGVRMFAHPYYWSAFILIGEDR